MLNKIKILFKVLFPTYQSSLQPFRRLPFPLLMRCLLMYLCGFFMFIFGVVIAISTNRYQAIIAGAILGITFACIGLWNSYIFTRKKYVRVFAYVIRREKNRHLLRKEPSTFIMFPDGSERELLLGKKKLNIGAEYAFYFAQRNKTVEPNCNIIYGYEPAAEADKQIAFNKQLDEAINTQKQELATLDENQSSNIIKFPTQK